MSESYLYLGLQQIGGFAQVRVAVGILQLQTAFGVEPPLHAGHVVGLTVLHHLVAVEVVHGGYNVKLGQNVYRGYGVVTVATYISVLTVQEFCAYIYRAKF